MNFPDNKCFEVIRYIMNCATNHVFFQWVVNIYWLGIKACASIMQHVIYLWRVHEKHVLKKYMPTTLLEVQFFQKRTIWQVTSAISLYHVNYDINSLKRISENIFLHIVVFVTDYFPFSSLPLVEDKQTTRCLYLPGSIWSCTWL